MSVEYAIAGHVVTALASGKRTWKRSPFAYRSMCTAQAVLDSLGGSTPRLEIPAEQAADTYQQIARIQAVKCSTSHDASRPTREMLENCPGRYASPELSTLMPGVLIGLGRGAAVALDALGPIDWTEEGEHFSRGHLRFGERHAEPQPSPPRAGRSGLAERPLEAQSRSRMQPA